jgi:23S rRNA pseudouridine2605 synthase
MRINKFIAQATGLSRREVDALISAQKVTVNNLIAQTGLQITEEDSIILNGKKLRLQALTTILLNKPVGYVCSRNGQGSKTIYDLLPKQYHNLKTAGRLDKDSSGLLLLTNDGTLANTLTHPSFDKNKVYEVQLNKALSLQDKLKIEHGIELEDGISALQLKGRDKKWVVTMKEGRNRQIRRTFNQLDYTVTKLHRIRFGNYSIDDLSGKLFSVISQ